MARERVLQFDDHMSDNEALMWNVEKDPAMSSWFASITILDRAPDMEKLRNRLRTVVVAVPRLRQRVAPTLGRLAPPRWVDDPDFDFDFHIRRVAVPSPGGDDELHDLAVKVLLDPFERTRPLWQFVVIEGLGGGRAALIQKMHHTITDGEGGVRLAERFVDIERDVPVDDYVEIPPARPDLDAIADFGGAAQEALRHNASRFGGVAQRVARSVVTHPVGTAVGVGRVLAEVRKTLFPSDTGVHVGSEIWQPRTLRRWFGTVRVPFDDVRRAAKGMGGTVNDLFVAGALIGAARYHADRDQLPDRLRVAMPVSTRSGGTAGGNSFALTTSDLEALVDPEAAFSAVRAGLEAAKSGAAVDVLGSLSMVINLLPTSVIASFAKDTAATVDFTVSNVRGAPVPLYIAGARCEGLYPMGPISGTAFNLTTMSYAGNLDMGLVVDAGAVEDPPGLRDVIDAAYVDLLAAGG